MLVHVVLLWLLASDAGSPCQALFEPPKGAVKLCDQHVLAVGAEIEWTSWVVATDRQATFESYRRRATECKVALGEPFTLEDGPQRLAVHAVSDADFPTCSKAPRSGDRSVVVISVKHERSGAVPRAH
jgi:hypothetical protein